MATLSNQPSDAAAAGLAPLDAVAGQLYCDGCERAVAGLGCRRWDRYTLCPRCQEEYITAWAAGRRVSPGQYIRDKRFGEEESYALPS